jgi:SAM-dependent methyltransferase
VGQDLEKPLSDASFWHFRYTQQAGWTRATRRYLFSQAGVQPGDRILEAGCGCGAVLESLAADGFTNLTGIDLDFRALPEPPRPFDYACADGLSLPFPARSFDHAMCHFTLMWARDPRKMVREMARVTQAGGWVFALAEPDYGGRIGYPALLEKLADLQTRSLRIQGANTAMGRELMALLASCGLAHISGGIIGAETRDSASNPLSGDPRVLRRDLAQVLDNEQAEGVLAEAEKAASRPGVMWYVPTCFACGRVR